MFNVTIVSLKDLLKYLTGIIIAFCILFIITKVFINEKANEKLISDLGGKIHFFSIHKSFTYCLDQTLPGIKTNEGKNILSEENKLEKLLQVELARAETEVVKEIDDKNNIEQNEEERVKEEVEKKEIEEVSQVSTEVVTENPISTNNTDLYDLVKIKNETSYELSQEILEPNIEVENNNIVIFHTHTCESYTSSEQYSYEPTGTYRTTDLSYSVARVGDELTNYLGEYGYNVIHDKTYHDYPAYTGSYSRSLNTVENILKSTDADIIIDLHRDAIGSNSNYAPTVRIGDEYAAQLMFVIRNRWWWIMASKLESKFKICN